jgi:MFS family permease
MPILVSREGSRTDGHPDFLEARGIGSVQKQALFSSFIGWMFDGYETSTLILVGAAAMISLLPAPDPASVQWGVGLSIGSTLLGWALGGVIGSVFADYVGRKPMLIISIAGYSAFTALTALSPNLHSLIALRFLTGLFLGSEWSTGTAMIAETWPASVRAKALGIMQSGFGFGFLLASGMWLILQPLLGSEGWRWMFAFGVLPALFLMFIRRELPESQVWLDAIRRRQWTTTEHKGAQPSLTDKRPFTLGQIISDPLSRSRILKTLVITCITVAVFYGTSSLIPPYVGSIATKAGLDGRYWASMTAVVYNIGAIAGYISAGFIADAIGRKPYMLFLFTGGLLTGPIMFLIPPVLTSALGASAVLGFFTLGAFSWMPIYLPELFATNVRSTASGFVFNLARLIAFPAPIYAAWLFTVLGGPARSVTTLSLLFLVSLIVVCFLPETKGKALPE